MSWYLAWDVAACFYQIQRQGTHLCTSFCPAVVFIGGGIDDGASATEVLSPPSGSPGAAYLDPTGADTGNLDGKLLLLFCFFVGREFCIQKPARSMLQLTDM